MRPTKAESSSSLTGHDGEGGAVQSKIREILRGFVGSYNGNIDRGSGKIAKGSTLHGQFGMKMRAMRLSEYRFEEGR